MTTKIGAMISCSPYLKMDRIDVSFDKMLLGMVAANRLLLVAVHHTPNTRPLPIYTFGVVLPIGFTLSSGTRMFYWRCSRSTCLRSTRPSLTSSRKRMMRRRWGAGLWWVWKRLLVRVGRHTTVLRHWRQFVVVTYGWAGGTRRRKMQRVFCKIGVGTVQGSRNEIIRQGIGYRVGSHT